MKTDYSEPTCSYGEPDNADRWELVKDAMIVSVMAVLMALMLASGV